MSGNTNGGVRLPIPVRAVNTNDPTQSRIFPSLGSAAKFAKECGVTDPKPDRIIKRVLNNNEEYVGYYWISASADDVANAQMLQLHDSFPMLFEDQTCNIRVTSETPRRVSVYDLIEAVTGVVDPRTAFYSIEQQYPEVAGLVRNFTFPGLGQRPTPVTDAYGVVRIANVLQGPRAVRFRDTSARILVRYLGGDETLIAEIRANNELQALLPQDHPMRIFGEAVDNNIPKFMFSSPNMNDKYLCDFIGKKVVYLVIFEYEGQLYIKFGKSEICKDRMASHFRTYPNAIIYCMYEVTELKKVEDTFKAAMKYRNKLTSVTINGNNFTEIITNIRPEEAESILTKTIDDVHRKIDNETDNVVQLAEIRLREKELEVELEKTKMTYHVSIIEMLMKAGVQGEHMVTLMQKIL